MVAVITDFVVLFINIRVEMQKIELVMCNKCLGSTMTIKIRSTIEIKHKE